MPAGMQCWDETGKLVVDIGDYNCRYIGALNVSFPANTAVITASYSGLKADGSFGVVVATTSGGGVSSIAEFAVRTYDGGFRVFGISPGNAAATLTVNLYGFL
ncbi:hypothetical protein NG99_22305 [Erwinia typographi]|uniref:Uncharacterized protein n=1 Tax=Erwinia typographi TaxID=371042 RepID=A0A0A3YMN4_9GAMM|nr:hypothetical protein [Erwinia typographi]KGT88037.1 hypothetical protein NG99_22305 [Erwinia typographi]